MTLKSYLLGIKIATVVSFGALAMVTIQVDPEKTGVIGQVLFFISVMLFLSGLFILFFTWLKKNALKDDVEFSHLGISFRQGVLMALLVTILLFLQQYRVLTWWDGALTVVGILLIELYFLTRR